MLIKNKSKKNSELFKIIIIIIIIIIISVSKWGNPCLAKLNAR